MNVLVTKLKSPKITPMNSAFLNFCIKNNIKHNFIYMEDLKIKHLKNYDLVLTSATNKGVNKKVDNILNKCRELNLLFLVLGDGYLKRTSDNDNDNGYLSITRNGIQAYGYHEYETNLPSDRWNKLELELKPWNKNGTDIVISHQHVNCFEYSDDGDRQNHYMNIIKNLLKTDFNIKIVLHPRYKSTYTRAKNFITYCTNMNIPIYKCKTIELFDKNTHCNILFDSNTAIESIILGIPVFSIGKTMADMIINKYGIDDINNPKRLNRKEWCNWIAYQQWTVKEIEEGIFLEYFKIKL